MNEEKIKELIYAGGLENLELAKMLCVTNQIDYLDIIKEIFDVDIPKVLSQMMETTSYIMNEDKSNKIPEYIFYCKNISSIEITNKELKEIPKDLLKIKSLKRLILSKCSLVEIPEFIGEFEQLNYLDVSYNKITNISENVINSLQKFKNLTILLEDNPIEIDTDFMVKLQYQTPNIKWTNLREMTTLLMRKMTNRKV